MKNRFVKSFALFLVVLLSSCSGGNPSSEAPSSLQATSLSSSEKEQEKYTVTWLNYDGSTIEVDHNVLAGQTPSFDGQTPTKPNTAEYTYTFSGWSPNIEPVTADKTYVAQFSETINNYLISWNIEGKITTESYDYGETPTYKGETPTKAPTDHSTFAFSGWSPEISRVTGNKTYIAQFTETLNSYTISWNIEGNITTETYDYGETPSYKGATPTKASTIEHAYVFSGWSPEITNVAGDKTYTAQFTEGARNYSVTWKNYDGTTLEVDTGVPYGTTPTFDGATPQKPTDNQYSYAWNGWTPSVGAVSGDATYTATYEATLENAKVIFDLNGGTSSSHTGALYMPRIEKEFFFFDVTKTGFKFRGWSYNGEKVFDGNGNKVSNPTIVAEMTFVAIFSSTVELSINTNMPEAGTISGAGEYAFNQQVSVSAEPKQGYSFLGWYFNGICLSTQKNYSYMMWSDDVTLDAVFGLSSFNLRVYAYNPEYGKVAIQNHDTTAQSDSNCDFNYTQNVAIASVTTGEATFLGWFLEDGTLVNPAAFYNFTMPNVDYTLVAKWDAFNLELHSNAGGTVTGEGTYASNEEVTLTATPDVGYHLEGWYLEDELVSTDEVFVVSMPQNNVTYVAKFEITHYSITATSENESRGIVTVSGAFTYNTTATFVATPLTGYRFVGWYCDDALVSNDLSYTLTVGTEDESFVAKFEPIVYTISYVLNEGVLSEENPTNYTIEDEISLSSPTKLHYSFSGWTNQHGDDVTSIAVGTNGNLVLTANWEPNQYAINYVLDGGVNNSGNPSNYTFVSPTFDLLAPTKNSDIFDGWYLEDTFETEIRTIEKGSSENITLYAKWMGVTTSANSTGLTITGVVDSDSFSKFELKSNYYKPVIASFGESCFKNCKQLISVIFPNTVTSIGASAFNGCTSLTSIEIPDSITSICDSTFKGCSNLTSIAIPNSVTSIGDAALSSCARLTSVSIPNSVTSIGAGALSGCGSLTSITIPDSVTSIDHHAFSSCDNLVSVTLSNSITSISDYAFSFCSNLASIKIPDSVTSIGEYAFSWCYRLVSVTNSNSVISIGGHAFFDCMKLASISIPNSTIAIGDYAFGGCSHLTSITIPDSVTSIGDYAFRYCSSLTSITIPDSVTSINNGAFYGCTGPTAIEIPDSITSIGDYAFRGCSSLTSITIPDSVTSIGNEAFYGCTGLASIVIPESVTSMGRGAFATCPDLVIYCESPSQPANWNANWSGSATVVWGYTQNS